MYRLTELQDALGHLVGFEQDLNPVNSIDASLMESESGLYFQGAHPLVTLTTIKRNMPADWLLQYPEWNNTAQYKTSAKVRYKGSLWESLSDNNTGEPPSSTWREVDYFSDYLHKQVRTGIGTMIQRFVRDKMVDRLAPDMLQRQTFFDGAGYMYDKIPPNSTTNIVGFELVPRRTMGITTKIERIGLQFTGGAGTVTLYLFHSSLLSPVKTVDVTIKGGGSFEWFSMKEWYLPYIGDNNAGGSWYIVYAQDRLPAGAQAVRVDRDFSKRPNTGCCGSLGNASSRRFTENLEFYPFSNDGYLDEATPELWNVTRNIYPGSTNYGINVEITVGCDLTDFIKSQRQAFASCLQKQVASDFMRRMAFNPDDRVNHEQLKMSAERIAYEIDGEPGKKSRFAKDLDDEYKALNVNTQGIDKVCLPCNNRGIKYRNA